MYTLGRLYKYIFMIWSDCTMYGILSPGPRISYPEELIHNKTLEHDLSMTVLTVD